MPREPMFASWLALAVNSMNIYVHLKKKNSVRLESAIRIANIS